MEMGQWETSLVFSIGFCLMTSVFKGWTDPRELPGGASPLPDSRKGLLDARARKGKEREDLAKHHIFQTQLIWGSATFSSPKHTSFHACQTAMSRVSRLRWRSKPTWPFGRAWSRLGKQQFPVSKTLARLHELITVIPAEISGTF